jgi:hypothetical protein
VVAFEKNPLKHCVLGRLSMQVTSIAVLVKLVCSLTQQVAETRWAKVKNIIVKTARNNSIDKLFSLPLFFITSNPLFQPDFYNLNQI